MLTLKKISIFCVVLCLQAGSLLVEAATPVVPPNSVVNNASFAAGTNPLAPGTIAAIFGTNLNDGSQNPSSSFGSNGKLLTTLGSASVTFNGISAPMFASFPGQLTVQIPFELAGQTSATVVVTVNGQSSAPQTVPIGPMSPGIFTVNNQGTGQGIIQIANTNIFAATTGSIAGALAEPATRGDFLTIYATGLGAVNNLPATGAPASGGNSTTITLPQVTIAGMTVPVTFAGLAPGFVGLYQVNVAVPMGVPTTGNAVPLVLSIGGKQSNTVMLPVYTGGSGSTVVVQGTTQSASVLVPGRGNFGLDNTATGIMSVSATGTSSGSQTVYTVTGSGSGTVSCQGITGSNTSSNWTVSLTGTTTVSPAVTSLVTNGGAVSGTLALSFSLSACGQTQSAPVNGTVTGTVSAGGAVTLTLNFGGS